MKKWMVPLMTILLTAISSPDTVSAGVPSITGLSDFAYTEQDPATAIDSDVTFSNGSNY
jgi:hypothetical protein